VLGVRKFTNKPARGQVLSFSSTGVTGWAQDPDQPTNNTTVFIIVSIDGKVVQATNSPGNAVAANVATSAALTRAIGTPNHGFVYNYAKLSRGVHLVKVFATDSVTGISSLIGSKNLVVVV
jgi:hypothetical protein